MHSAKIEVATEQAKFKRAQGQAELGKLNAIRSYRLQTAIESRIAGWR